jgi:hypothetical protein
MILLSWPLTLIRPLPPRNYKPVSSLFNIGLPNGNWRPIILNPPMPPLPLVELHVPGFTSTTSNVPKQKKFTVIVTFCNGCYHCALQLLLVILVAAVPGVGRVQGTAVRGLQRSTIRRRSADMDCTSRRQRALCADLPRATCGRTSDTGGAHRSATGS